ncbi:MAG: hypothetical protein DBX55_02010 [Verrucomicrobia bacterium]|nr:MAG: hypothetical protein DBX55_02010 [Verrucomicrobiota bacterium]
MSNFPPKAKQMKIISTLLFTAALAACVFAQEPARQTQPAQSNPQCQCQATPPACCAASRPNAPADEKEKRAQSAAADSAKDNSKSASGATAGDGQKGKVTSSARRQNSGTRKNIQRDEL